MSKIYVICTGGTISMVDTKHLQYGEQITFEEAVRKILPVGEEYPTVDFKVYSPLIDSSEMNVERYNQIVQDIREKYHEYDGFVILHGTDTMAYTASALSFMLGNLAKPVVLTGSQTPLSAVINDARENIINAVFLAASKKLNEVCICFNRTVFRGNRTSKYSTNDYDAYISANYPELGRIESSIKLDKNVLLPKPATTELTTTNLENFDVRPIIITPNITPAVFEKMIEGAKAVVLCSYGDGNISIRDERYLEIIKKHRAQGVVFINKSQCIRSNTIPMYDAGHLLAEAGMISAGDQTLETLIFKLHYLMSKKLKPQDIEREMQQSIRGELTPIKQIKRRFTLFQAKPVNDIDRDNKQTQKKNSNPLIK